MSNRLKSIRTKKPPHRPDTYSQDKADEICTHIAQGKSLRSYCEKKGNAPLVTVRKWLGKYEDFRNQYARAREEQADFYADEIAEIADTEPDPHKARVRIDARKWIASKLKSKTYGDKVAHVGGGDDDNPIRYVDEADAFTRRIAAGAARIGADSSPSETEH